MQYTKFKFEIQMIYLTLIKLIIIINSLEYYRSLKIVKAIYTYTISEITETKYLIRIQGKKYHRE